MFDSIMTPVMVLSPATSCEQISFMTFGWLLWFFCELPSSNMMSPCTTTNGERHTTAVDHDARVVSGTGLPNGFGGCLNMFGCVVGTFGASTEDDMDILVPPCLDDGSETVLGHTHECMGIRRRTHGIDSDRDTDTRNT